MTLNPVSMLIIAAFLYPIMRGFIRTFSSQNFKNDLNDIEGDIAFVVSLISGFYLIKQSLMQRDGGIYSLISSYLPGNIQSIFESNPTLLYVVALPLIVFILYKVCRLVFSLINYVTFYPFADHIDNVLSNKRSLVRRIIGALFEIPKAISYVLVITFLINFISIISIIPVMEAYIEKSVPYNYLCKEIVIPITNSKLARQLPDIINNSFRVEIVQNNETASSKTAKGRTIVYYNGVTLDEGIRSNSDIDKFARELVKNETTDMAKAKDFYNWIGKNINYDHEKANQVLNNNFNIKSGAIPTFEERKGICFDYSCLFVAMCREEGLKVRLITGEGFNGVSWVSHAWNQVYISEEGKWINVDTTFYKGGNYFGSRRFDMDHKDAKIAGEW